MQQHHFELQEHRTLKGFLLFGGLTAGLAWTLYVVTLGLVSLAEEIRKVQ